MTVAEVEPMLLTATLLITGVAFTVVKVELGEVEGVPAELAETTSKSYRVPALKPVMVTEWLVTSAVFKVEEEP